MISVNTPERCVTVVFTRDQDERTRTRLDNGVRLTDKVFFRLADFRGLSGIARMTAVSISILYVIYSRGPSVQLAIALFQCILHSSCESTSIRLQFQS